MHVLLGNHEAMNLYGDLRYVPSEAEYESYRKPDSVEKREAYWNQHVEEMEGRKASRPTTRSTGTKWEREHPLGWFEHRLAFSPTGTYGKWLRDRKALIQINDLLFLHGGIGPKYVDNGSSQNSIEESVMSWRISVNWKEGSRMDPEGPL